MNFSPGNAQHIGSREEQQDACGLSDPNNQSFVAHGGIATVVCDGIGGLVNGSEASRTAVRAFLQAYGDKQPREGIPDALRRSLQHANEVVYEMSVKTGVQDRSGTTLVATVVHDGELNWISAGDSRAYLVRNGSIRQITRDQTFATFLEEQVREGTITREQAARNPDRGALTSYVGISELKQFDQSERPIPLHSGDFIISCSDGVYRALAPDEMVRLAAGRPQEIAERLVQSTLAKKLPKQDNLTAIVIGCEGESTKARENPALFLTLAAFLVLVIIGLLVL